MVVRAAEAPGTITVLGEICPGDEIQLGKQVDNAGGAPIVIRLSSCGGEFYTARRMLEILDQLDSVKIECFGQVASAATLLLCAQNASVSAEDGCSFLVHGASVSCLSGDVAELGRVATELADVNRSMLGIYSRRMQTEDVAPMLEVDTVFGAERAQSLGLIDTIAPLRVAAQGCRLVASARLLTAAQVAKQEDDTMEKDKGLKKAAASDADEKDKEKVEAKIRARLKALAPKFANRPAARAIYSLHAQGFVPTAETIMSILESTLDELGVPEEEQEQLAEEIVEEIEDEVAAEEEAALPVHVSAKKKKQKVVAASIPTISWEGWR